MIIKRQEKPNKELDGEELYYSIGVVKTGDQSQSTQKSFGAVTLNTTQISNSTP